MTQHAFGEIGKAYAESYKELETARTAYENDRDRILTKLAEQAQALSGVPPTRENAEYVTSYLPETQWWKTRSPMSRGSKAGFTVAVGAVPWFGDSGAIVFAAYTFFQLGAPGLAKIHAAPLGAELGLVGGGRPPFARIKSRVIAVTDEDFRLEVFERELEKVHEAFRDVDARVTSVYRKAIGLAT